MRTDSTHLSTEALAATKDFVENKFGKEFLPESANVYKTKVANAQEAHEAIRPAGRNFKQTNEMSGLGKDELQLIESNDFLARLEAQTCRQLGLPYVYEELFNFFNLTKIFISNLRRGIRIFHIDVCRARQRFERHRKLRNQNLYNTSCTRLFYAMETTNAAPEQWLRLGDRR